MASGHIDALGRGNLVSKNLDMRTSPSPSEHSTCEEDVVQMVQQVTRPRKNPWFQRPPKFGGAMDPHLVRTCRNHCSSPRNPAPFEADHLVLNTVDPAGRILPSVVRTIYYIVYGCCGLFIAVCIAFSHVYCTALEGPRNMSTPERPAFV